MTEEIREVTDEERQQAIFQEFLEKTKERFDKYFHELGYVCFLFNKKTHKGQSVYITNSPEDFGPIIYPYSNVENIEINKELKAKNKKERRKIIV